MNDESTPQLDGSQLLEATQNAVIEAVDNVSGIIAETSTQQHEAHPHEIFYKTAEFWVGFAFILVIVALAKPVSRLLRNMLLKRRDAIIDRISQAEKLHDDAQKLLAEYERKYINADQEADEIVQKSKKQTALYRTEEIQKLNAELNLKKREADGAIASAQMQTINEINAKAADKAVKAAKKYILDHLDKKQQNKLIDNSIEHIIENF